MDAFKREIQKSGVWWTCPYDRPPRDWRKLYKRAARAALKADLRKEDHEPAVDACEGDCPYCMGEP